MLEKILDWFYENPQWSMILKFGVGVWLIEIMIKHSCNNLN